MIRGEPERERERERERYYTSLYNDNSNIYHMDFCALRERYEADTFTLIFLYELQNKCSLQAKTNEGARERERERARAREERIEKFDKNGCF